MPNPLDMVGRTVLITGASSGLGAAAAAKFAELGARVGLLARDAQRLEQVRSRLTGEGHFTASVDLTATDAIPAKLRELAQQFGPFHAVVHSAGTMQLRPLRQLTAADWETGLRVNVLAAAALAKGFRQPGVNAGGGSVVFLASVTALVGHTAQSVYGASKGALIALARSLAVELARENIRVNCVAPAVVESGMSDALKSGMTAEQWVRVAAQHPLGLGRPDDVANAIAFLAADSGRWITGTTLVVDGGYTAQ